MTAAVALAAAARPSLCAGQPHQSPVPVLDVPYLPQSEALCGGAAIAMVMRFWGTPAVYAETFSDLVDAGAGGIHARDLVRALDGRGFETRSFQGDEARIKAALEARRPPIVLIEDRPGRFHYVVVVGWRDDHVIVHDPARAPFHVLSADAFIRAWSAAQFWTLLAQPRRASSATSDPVSNSASHNPDSSRETVLAPVVTRGVCTGMVEEGVRLAGTGDLAAAQRILDLSALDCPDDPAPWRELAGVHALRGEWAEAARDARRALDRDSTDQHSTRILATSLFLEGDDAAALDAWNRIGTPVVDVVDIRGLERTRFAVAGAALDLPPETLLTRARLNRARRRLAALPSIMGSRVSYKPGEDDRAQVNAAVFERPLMPSGFLALAASALKTATDRELTLAVASPTGGGELWSASWRWWDRRPRVALGLEAPSPFGGVWSVDAFAERQAYGAPASEILERRRGVVLKASDWISGGTRIEGAGAIDRWLDGTTVSIGGGIQQVFASGRGIAELDGTLMTGAYKAGLVNVGADWRSADLHAGSVWHARAGFSLAGSAAPLAFWPGAGTGHGRDVLLRGHPLLSDGVVRGVFGRRLAHGGVEWRYWTGPVFRMLHVAPAVFVDAARAFHVPTFGDGRAHLDAGAGLRIAVPGAGVLRIDLARGVRDHKTALSFGWTR